MKVSEINRRTINWLDIGQSVFQAILLAALFGLALFRAQNGDSVWLQIVCAQPPMYFLITSILRLIRRAKTPDTALAQEA